MIHINRFKDIKQIKSNLIREHNKIIKRYNIEFISLEGSKIPLICLYEIVFNLFENSSVYFKISDIILLTLTSIGILSKENKDKIYILVKVLKEKNIYKDLRLVKNTIKSIKNLLNIIFKKDFIIIKNIEQALKYKFSIEIFNTTSKYIKDNKIQLKDFSYWYITDQRNVQSKNLINYINEKY